VGYATVQTEINASEIHTIAMSSVGPTCDIYIYIYIYILSRVLSARGNNKRGFSGFDEGVYLNNCSDYTQQV
jgi:hypothetical protein